MAIKFIWEDAEKTLVRIDIDGDWTLGTLEPIVKSILAETRDHPFDVIVNYSDRVTPPKDLLSVGRGVTPMIPPNARFVVSVVGNNVLLSAMGKIYQSLYGKRSGIQLMVARSLNEAYSIINQARQTTASTAE